MLLKKSRRNSRIRSRRRTINNTQRRNSRSRRRVINNKIQYGGSDANQLSLHVAAQKGNAAVVRALLAAP